MKLVFATNNQNKLKEITHLLGDSFKLVSLKDLQISDDIPEDYPTLEENALFKARYINKLTGMNVFADDTGLEIEALDGRPGVHSARFAGQGKDFEANIDKVLLLLNRMENRSAAFRTIIALLLEDEEYLFEGKVTGTILNERRGNNGFGYDPIFLPDGMDLTFAEISLEEKNRLSHRAEAFKKLKMFLSQFNGSDNNRAV
ncbi:MAG: RdgB/HAM1 family non-canonical purine NTP pyrophosphatase [Bacteroidales bacterium]|jgi:XTP/dITP diphosphohydrolase